MINNKISDLEKAYFAGLFDGEGSVRINKQDRDLSNGEKSKVYKLIVDFGLTYKQVLLDMKKLFGGSLSERNMEKQRNSDHSKKLCSVGGASPENWKQSYVYTLSGWDARCFLKTIEPFCREKKEQVIIAIEFENSKKQGSTSEHETKRGEYYYLKLQELKRNNANEIESIDKNECVFEDNQLSLGLFEVK